MWDCFKNLFEKYLREDHPKSDLKVIDTCLIKKLIKSVAKLKLAYLWAEGPTKENNSSDTQVITYMIYYSRSNSFAYCQMRWESLFIEVSFQQVLQQRFNDSSTTLRIATCCMRVCYWHPSIDQLQPTPIVKPYNKDYPNRFYLSACMKCSKLVLNPSSNKNWKEHWFFYKKFEFYGHTKSSP